MKKPVNRFLRRFEVPKAPKAKRCDCPALPWVRRAADFADSGEYDVTLSSGENVVIRRDQWNRTWHVDLPGVAALTHDAYLLQEDTRDALVARLERGDHKRAHK